MTMAEVVQSSERFYSRSVWIFTLGNGVANPVVIEI